MSHYVYHVSIKDWGNERLIKPKVLPDNPEVKGICVANSIPLCLSAYWGRDGKKNHFVYRTRVNESDLRKSYVFDAHLTTERYLITPKVFKKVAIIDSSFFWAMEYHYMFLNERPCKTKAEKKVLHTMVMRRINYYLKSEMHYV